MLYQREKIEKILKAKKEKAEAIKKSRGYSEDYDEKLTFDDILAIVISATIVFGPIFLVLLILLYLVVIIW
ncbi:hypothetical protein SAMN02745227_01521 [Anaerobranca californiensis DSM 14826]|uniref:Uncharacterized protein n=1 Tax=Anaerobranca californiensis DSM 14826 TaxID=1120989 RepID=A0A1M6PRQ1_9FIRM|nr:hypothetical protein [Anaerobranca californiensis]SHK10561.1 hypothetical protein SAMN02745227_01521 [Anaerobranca californiensis DSM 14826]